MASRDEETFKRSGAPPRTKLFDTINIIAFNRPDYFNQTLSSLCEQNLSKFGARLHVWIDGYNGSLDEQRGVPNRTGEVVELATTHLPNALIHRHSDNLGIAAIYDRAEKFSCLNSAAPYILFFEDDLVLGPRYLEALEILMDWALDIPDVAIVTAHGYSHEYLGLAKRHLSFSAGLRYAHSLWAFAVKAEHLKERQPFIDGYLSLMNGRRYQNRDHKTIIEYFHSCGATFISGTSQDYAKHAALWLFEKCALTTSFRLSRYIGQEGQHSDPALFQALGYGDGDLQDFNSESLKAMLPKTPDLTCLKATRLLELQIIKFGL